MNSKLPSRPTQNQPKSQILFHKKSSLRNLCTMTLFSDGREVSIRSQIEWWRPSAIRMMCAGGSCILILDRDDNGIESEVLFFPIYFQTGIRLLLWFDRKHSWKFVKFLEMYVSKKVLEISNSLSMWQEI